MVKLDLIGLCLVMAEARMAGAAAGCDYPQVPAEQAWMAWSDERSRAWHNSVSDEAYKMLRDLFIVAWGKEFSRRYPATARMVS